MKEIFIQKPLGESNLEDYGDYLEKMAAIPYEEKHHPDKQTQIIDGICINPELREGFDSTSNEDRDSLEVRDWWGRPFILESEYQPADKTYNSFVKRLKSYNSDADIEPQNEWEQRTADEKHRFDENYPHGKVYTVRCLSGGAWDRSSWCGDFATLDEALNHAHNIDGNVFSGLSYKVQAEN